MPLGTDSVSISKHQDPDCYQVLALQQPFPGRPAVSQEQIKRAYRHALLAHHPDKSRIAVTSQPNTTQYTIDQVTTAYQTLIHPARRLEHDKQLRAKPHIKSDSDCVKSHAGIDTLDLDELDHDGYSNEWHRDCRCGDDKGFRVTEDDLQRSSDAGEMITECQGCSLRLRVKFGVA
ncbi:MAG: hypothetical protein Q9223_000402 [Gallowayella weberi]